MPFILASPTVFSSDKYKLTSQFYSVTTWKNWTSAVSFAQADEDIGRPSENRSVSFGVKPFAISSQRASNPFDKVGHFQTCPMEIYVMLSCWSKFSLVSSRTAFASTLELLSGLSYEAGSLECSICMYILILGNKINFCCRFKRQSLLQSGAILD